jgi:NAD(P)-dependent dehydrogenase (short-subunit alcohol dehydrogenase family)
MATIDASQLLRPGLLEGVSIVLARVSPAGDDDESPARTVGAACSGLGARVLELPIKMDRAGVDEPGLDEAVGRLIGEAGSLEMLVVDGAGLFAWALRRSAVEGGPASARVALRACLDSSWSVTHAVVNRAFLPAKRRGRMVYITPSGDAGEHASAASSGLGNLARTLSIEWARHGITAVAVVPASGSAGEAGSQVAALTAYLASSAGAYFSGCLLDLSGVGD